MHSDARDFIRGAVSGKDTSAEQEQRQENAYETWEEKDNPIATAIERNSWLLFAFGLTISFAMAKAFGGGTLKSIMALGIFCGLVILERTVHFIAKSIKDGTLIDTQTRPAMFFLVVLMGFMLADGAIVGTKLMGNELPAWLESWAGYGSIMQGGIAFLCLIWLQYLDPRFRARAEVNGARASAFAADELNRIANRRAQIRADRAVRILQAEAQDRLTQATQKALGGFTAWWARRGKAKAAAVVLYDDAGALLGRSVDSLTTTTLPGGGGDGQPAKRTELPSMSVPDASSFWRGWRRPKGRA